MGIGLDCFLDFPRLVFSFLISPWVHLLGACRLQGVFVYSFPFSIPFFIPRRPLIHVFFFLFRTVLDTISLILFVLYTFLSFIFAGEGLISLTVLRSASLWETSIIMGQMVVCTLAMLFLSVLQITFAFS
jgi:hypothetical protein